MDKETIQKEIEKLDPDVRGYIYNLGAESKNNHNLYASQETRSFITELKEKQAQQFGLTQSIYETIHSEFGIMTILKEIKTQVTATNGRVNKLEEVKNKNDGWVKGFGITTGILITIMLAFASYVIYNLDTIREKVTSHIASDTKEFNNFNK
jgi:hypothetical protein